MSADAAQALFEGNLQLLMPGASIERRRPYHPRFSREQVPGTRSAGLMRSCFDAQPALKDWEWECAPGQQCVVEGG